MSDHARTLPGYIAERFYRSADGERLTVVWWRGLDTLEAWRNDARHRAAQQLGRERWYASFNSDVAEVVRSSSFERPGEASAGEG